MQLVFVGAEQIELVFVYRQQIELEMAVTASFFVLASVASAYLGHRYSIHNMKRMCAILVKNNDNYSRKKSGERVAYDIYVF